MEGALEMEKMMRDKTAVKIICIVLATILWLYVSFQENPTMSKTVKNVPLAITGEQALKENGFSVYSVSEKSIDVKVTAKRLSLAKASNKTLSAVINVSSIKESGKYVIPATVSSSLSGATYYVKGKDVTVVIEAMQKDTFPIVADITESHNSKLIVSSHKLSHKKVSVSAPKSILNAIETVRTEQIIPNDKENVQSARLIAYAKDGSVLDGVVCTPSHVEVSYSFYDIKTVPVVLKTTDGNTHTLPAQYTVKIYGKGEGFDKIKQIETEEINLNQFEAESKVRIKLSFPKSAMPLDNANEVEIELKEKYYE